MDDERQGVTDSAAIEASLTYHLVNSARVEIFGVAPQSLIEAFRRATSTVDGVSGLRPVEIEYYTLQHRIVLALSDQMSSGRVLRRWNSALVALRNLLANASVTYTAYSIDDDSPCCVIRFVRNDNAQHVVVIAELPGRGRGGAVMTELSAPAAHVIAALEDVKSTRRPLVIREIHCETVDRVTAERISGGQDDWAGPKISRFCPYGVAADPQQFLMPTAIVVIRGATHWGTIVYLKRRTPMTDHDDFGVLSLLSARVLEEDLDVALGVNLVDLPSGDDEALEHTWLEAGKPDPFVVPLTAFVHAAQRELYSSCGLHVDSDRLRFCGYQVLDHEKESQQFCFAVFDFVLMRSGDKDELRDVEAWNPTGMVRVDQDGLYRSQQPLNRLLRVRADWLKANVFTRKVGGMGG